MYDFDSSRVDFANPLGIYDLISDIAYYGTSQAEVTDNLTFIRKLADEQGKRKEFDEMLERTVRLLNEEECFKNRGFEMRYHFTKSDFESTEIPYRYVFFQKTPFLRDQKLAVISAEAKAVGYPSFMRTYKAFSSQMRLINTAVEGQSKLNPTDFPQQPIELEGGEWLCDFDGVRRQSGNGVEIACRHPIMPVERLVNIDTGEEKLKISYSKGRFWREIIASKKDLFDASKVLQLAVYGVSVTSKTAKTLSEYICDVENINYNIIPERQSISRLGYIADGQFAPYVDDIIFDGDPNYNNIFKAITQCGDYQKWLETAVECRKKLTAQIILASSFASVLVSRIGCLPFFVHLWGVDSGTGKTVALMLAASVWGNPDVGQYIQTFNATQVGHERTASFLNNIPMCIDELQLSKDSHGNLNFNVYTLAQGVGRSRGNKQGGLDRTPTWALCVLTTGESPIVSENSGAGAVNRVIDIECKASDKVIDDGFAVSSVIKQNYGFAGRIFVDSLTDEVIAEAKEKYQQYFRELSEGSTTEKQAMAAALVITADELADSFIFRTGKILTVAEISDFLKSKSSVSAGERGYNYMCDWVALNSNRFRQDNDLGDTYGVIDDNWAYINSSVFRKACRDGGFDDRALLSWLKSNNLILTRGRNFTRGKRINGINAECVVMKLRSVSSAEYSDFEQLIP